METNFDCIVIGAGPAGLSAALNLRQRGKTVLVVHSGETLLAKAEQVDNYLGMPGLSGKQMMERFTQHARDAGAVLRKGRAGNVMPFGGRFMVNLDGDILETGAVVLACGVSKAKPVPGEAELLGRGVSYCATCDGAFFRNKDVFVIGGGFTAAEESVFLTKFARHVTILIRKNDFACPASVADKARTHEKITVLFNTVVQEVSGDDGLRRIQYQNTATGEITDYQSPDGETIGVFVFAGYAPDTALVSGIAERDARGYIITDENQKTSVEGLYAAGDICVKPLRQVITAASDGAVAAAALEKYCAALRGEACL